MKELSLEEKATNAETQEHIMHVRNLLNIAVRELLRRGEVHDQSKLGDVERSTFVEYTPKLKNSTYGSDEYKGFLADMKPALDHHYSNNRHHPEHFDNGIEDMNLLDVLEMLLDWKAATMRHANGDLMKSIEINRERFGLDGQLVKILQNTVHDLGLFDYPRPVRDEAFVAQIGKLVREYNSGADYSLEREHASTQLEALAPSIARELVGWRLADRAVTESVADDCPADCPHAGKVHDHGTIEMVSAEYAEKTGAKVGDPMVAVGPEPMRPIQIVVNGESMTCELPEINYGRAVWMAGFKGRGSHYTVTWSMLGDATPGGSLYPGNLQAVIPCEGMVFSVADTSRA